jgi:transposase-like protein
MSRSIKRCPNAECGSANWTPRVGSIAGSHGDSSARYRCKTCGWKGDELEESTTDRPGNISQGLAAKLAKLGEEHDGDVPIRREGSA